MTVDQNAQLMFQKIEYSTLNARQKENFNFQKISGILADYGYNCLRLSDDWQGADFIACHIDGDRFFKIQLKGRLTLQKKYIAKDIYIAFFDKGDCYIYPHDMVMDATLANDRIMDSDSWRQHGSYSWPTIPRWAKDLLREYKVSQ